MVHAFSFCLYGPPNLRYYPRLLENLDIIKEHFPGWVAYVYIGEGVTDQTIQEITSHPIARVRMTGVAGERNMIHRFFAIDEPDVDLMLSRDADSYVHWKDRWAIKKFVESPQFVAHSIRDSPAHGAALLGGLWGIRKSAGLNIQSLHEEFLVHPTTNGCGVDQGFLAGYVYPRVLENLLVHYSNRMVFPNEIHAVEFPFAYTNDIYCGRIDPWEPPTPRKEPPKYSFPKVPVRLFK